MYLRKILPTIIVLSAVFLVTIVLGADKSGKTSKLAKQNTVTDGPIVPDNWKWHKIGTLWQRVTNFGKTGDDAYG